MKLTTIRIETLLAIAAGNKTNEQLRSVLRVDRNTVHGRVEYLVKMGLVSRTATRVIPIKGIGEWTRAAAVAVYDLTPTGRQLAEKNSCIHNEQTL